MIETCLASPDHNKAIHSPTSAILVLDMSGAIAAIFSLYDKWGGEHYIGERVTQLQHAQQVPTLSHRSKKDASDITCTTRHEPI